MLNITKNCILMWNVIAKAYKRAEISVRKGTETVSQRQKHTWSANMYNASVFIKSGDPKPIMQIHVAPFTVVGPARVRFPSRSSHWRAAFCKTVMFLKSLNNDAVIPPCSPVAPSAPQSAKSTRRTYEVFHHGKTELASTAGNKSCFLPNDGILCTIIIF